ncbi:MAG: helix-turn-helix domain-containing protein [Acidimicrobiales bacterium]
MSHKRWPRHADGDVAVDRILDAAGQAFAEHGVSRATMVDVAREAGCSRATLYRYFPNQEALQVSFVHRATLRIASRLDSARQDNGAESLTDRILSGIEAVRTDPLLAVWFEPENMAVPIAVSQNSELLRAMSVGLVGQLETNGTQRAEIERRGEWLLRTIISLLVMPGPSPEAERRMIDTYVVPVLTTQFDLDPRGSKK